MSPEPGFMADWTVSNCEIGYGELKVFFSDNVLHPLYSLDTERSDYNIYGGSPSTWYWAPRRIK